MKTDGRHSDQGRDEGTSNVVRLPRDWLGPREELVPFGPAAWGDDASKNQADVVDLAPRTEVVDLASSTEVAEERPVCSQVDFWGGDLGAIPRPIIAPPRRVASQTEPPVPPGRPARRRRTIARPHVVIPRPRIALRRLTSVLPRPRTTLRRLASAIPHRRERSLSTPLVSRVLAAPRPALPRPDVRAAAGVGGMVAVAVAAAGAFSGAPAHRAASGAYRAAAAHPTSEPAPLTVALVPHRLVHLRIPVSRAAGLQRHVRPARPSTSPSAATTTYVKVVATSTPPPSTSSSTPRSTEAPVSTTRSSTATAATTHTTQSGPVGQGAPFGPGHLG